MTYLLASIAYEVYLCRFMLGGKPTKTFDSFLLKFQFEKPDTEEFDAALMKQEIEESQNAWLNTFAIGAQAILGPVIRDAVKQANEVPLTRGKGKPRKKR